MHTCAKCTSAVSSLFEVPLRDKWPCRAGIGLDKHLNHWQSDGRYEAGKLEEGRKVVVKAQLVKGGGGGGDVC